MKCYVRCRLHKQRLSQESSIFTFSTIFFQITRVEVVVTSDPIVGSMSKLHYVQSPFRDIKRSPFLWIVSPLEDLPLGI